MPEGPKQGMLRYFPDAEIANDMIDPDRVEELL